MSVEIPCRSAHTQCGKPRCITSTQGIPSHPPPHSPRPLLHERDAETVRLQHLLAQRGSAHAFGTTRPHAMMTAPRLRADMCLMGMIEVTYEMRDAADFVVSSQYLQWALDAPYFHYIAGIDADTTPADLAILFADSYAAAAQALVNTPFTIAAVDMQGLDNVVAATDALAQALHDNLGEIAFTLDDIAFAVQRYDTIQEDEGEILGRYADLTHLAQLIEQELDAYPEIVAEAQVLQAAIAAHVIAEHHDSSTAFHLGNSHGVAIFFPTSTHSYYDGANNDFAVGTDWGAIVPGALTPDAVAQESLAWGPLLVDFVQQVNPDAPDTPDPPEPVARLRPPSADWRIFLPLVLR